MPLLGGACDEALELSGEVAGERGHPLPGGPHPWHGQWWADDGPVPPPASEVDGGGQERGPGS